MIRIQQLKLKAGHSEVELRQQILRKLRIAGEELLSYNIVKQSVDARKKPDIFFTYTVDAVVQAPERVVKRAKSPAIQIASQQAYTPPRSGAEKLNHRPVIIGTGPGGLFCGLLLARQGYRPLLLERGAAVSERARKIERFWAGKELDPHTNVQFGEGGAGTFSDGKLNTAVKDPSGRNGYVLESFVKAGAPEEIRWLGKPHIGTDILRSVIRNIRTEIIALGGEVRFMSCVTDMTVESGRLTALTINGTEQIDCQVVIPAIGHSARDTFEMFRKRGVQMSPKPFAVGLRIEHPQVMIDRSQYGRERGHELPAADYKLTRKAADGRGVYSFCMCPGGYVVNASSEAGGIAVNGMSYHSRAGENANSAMVVTVTPEDFGSSDVLAGVAFQRRLETAAYQTGQGAVPIQLLGDFAAGIDSTQLGEVNPCCKGAYRFGRLDQILPPAISRALTEGILGCGRIIKGFDRPDAVLSGVETRTSSPVRIERNEQFESNISGLYPCGEGAGYAGGITSAAMDGLKVAEAVIKRYRL